MKKFKVFWQQQRRNPLPLLLTMTGIYFVLLIVYIMRKEDKFESQWGPIYSTYYQDETGVMNFFKLLNKANIPAERWQRPYRFLDTSKTHNIWVIAPEEEYNMRDSDYVHLQKCIQKGSTLVFITNDNAYNMEKLLKTFDIQKLVETISWLDEIDREKIEILHPVSWFGHVDDVSFKKVEHKNSKKFNTNFKNQRIHYFHSDTFGIIPCMRAKGTEHAQIAMMHYGKGRIFLCSIPDMITNKGIQEKNNALFWVNLAKNIYASNGSPILFDEYTHGFGRDNLKMYDNWSPFKLPESKYVLWGMTLLFILYVYSMGKRIIKPVKVYEEPRRRVMEFVEAVANMYEKHQAHNSLLNETVQRFRKHLLLHLHLSQHSSNDEILQAYQKKHGTEQRQKLANLLSRIEKNKGKATLNEMTAIIQEIRTFCLHHKIEYFKI